MRLNLYVANAHLVYELELAQAVAKVTHNGYDIVLVELPTGEKVAIHLVERDIDVAYIKQILEANAHKDMYTLFMLWAAMLLPEHGELYLPYDWMSALLALYDDRIYAFEAEGSAAWLFPIHFDVVAGTVERSIRYGERLDMRRLRCETVITEAGVLNGQWRIADFGDGAARRPNQHAGPGQTETDETQWRDSGRRGGRSTIHVYYEILGVPIDADRETIRRAYRQLAMQYHPDHNDSPEAAEKMKAINAAYAHIMDFLGDAAE